MKKEIETFADVQVLVRSFYEKVLRDEILGHFFAYVKAHHWEQHLNVLDSFWNNILFSEGGYNGNTLEVHKTLHYFKKLEEKDFQRWLYLFNETVNELFVGDKATLAKQRALSIATIMRIKIIYNNGNAAVINDDNNN